MSSIPAAPLLQCLRDLDRAFEAFFSGRAKYPRFRQKGVNDAFRVRAADVALKRLNAKWSAVRLPKMGWVKFRDTRPSVGRLINITVSGKAGAWHAAFVYEREMPATQPIAAAVGIDRGIANTLALSDGTFLRLTNTTHLERRRRKAWRALSRRTRGSNRYESQRVKIARISAKLSRCRADWRHKITTRIAGQYGLVAIEALKVAQMSARGIGKRGINRSISEQGWGAFESTLAYKLEERSGALIKVNPAYTSQECSACGAIDKASRESQASFACRQCGFAGHADTNAANNILRRGTALMRGEGSAYAPVEPRTFNQAP